MADKIVADYIVKVDEAVKNLNRLEKEVKDLSTKGKKSAKDIESNFKKTSEGLISQFKKVGVALGLAFGTQQLVAIGKEAVTLASQMEGVERAFKRIGGANSDNLLDGLRKATRGTVSDLVLMQKAVQASNFKIPLENLASLFKFAQARARETGESVEYLTNSIVLGIGRKSPLILDNLGISAVELRERLKGVGVEAANVGDIAQIIGDIADEELSKMGEQADTTADKLAQMGTAYTNALTKGGEAIIQASSAVLDNFGIINENQATIDAFVASIQGLGSAELNAKLVQQLSEIESIRRRQTQLSNLDNKLAKESVLLEGDKLKANKELRGQVEKEQKEARKAIIDKNDFVASLRKQLAITTDIVELGGDFESYSPEQIALLEKVTEEQQKEIRNVAFLRAAIKELTDERELEGTSVERVKNITQLLIPLQEELNRLLGKETEEQKKLREELEKIALIRAQVFTGAEMAKGIPFVTSLSNTLNGLNQLLKEQRKILEESPEFSKRYNDASDAIDKLEKKIKEFNDDYIDPEKGFLGVSSADFINTDSQQQAFDDSINLWSSYAGQVSNIIGSISQIQANAYAYEQQELDKQLKDELITREEYDQKRAVLARKQAQAAKDAQLFQAIISTSQAIVAALGTVPFTPANIAFSALVGAAGAAQIAAIASTPIPQFAEGGWVDSKGKINGRKHAQGGVKIEAEGDEFIVKGSMAKKNASLLEALNKGTGQDWINKNMVYPAIQNVLDSGADGSSNQWNNLNVQFKDSNLIHAIDRDRQSTTYGLKLVASKLDKLSKRNNRTGW